MIMNSQQLQLVAFEYIFTKDKNKHIDHINCNKLDNRVENLRWATRCENMRNPITLEKLRRNMIGRKITENVKLKMRENSPNSKKVAQIDRNTNEIIKIYNSSMEAFRQTGIDQSRISKVCRGEAITAGKYKWKYINLN